MGAISSDPTAEERLEQWRDAFATSDELSDIATAALLAALRAHAAAALEAAARVVEADILSTEPYYDAGRTRIAAAIRALKEE